MSVQSRHSARIVSITRSACAFAFGAWIGVRMTRIPSDRSTVSNGPVNFASRSRMRNRAGLVRASSPRARLRACSGDPRRVGVRRCRTHVDPPAAQLDEHEDVQSPEPGGLDGAAVAGDDAIRVRAEELGPGWAGPSWGRPRSGRSEQGPDRRCADADPELPELPSDPDTTPSGVLPGEPEDERTDRRIDRWPAGAAGPAVRPLPPHEFAVPAEEGRRGDEEGDPALTRDRATGRREQDPVDDPEPGWARRPLQHPELMAENEDLKVLRSLGSTSLSGADEGADDEVDERPHRPIVPGGTSANLRFRPPRVRQAGKDSATLRAAVGFREGASLKRASAELVLDAHADVGEGPVWDAWSETLVWVDIMANELHRYNPTSGRDEITDVGQPVGCVALRRSGGVVLALRDGFAALDAEAGEPRLLAPVEAARPQHRMNDGKCDSEGRFWAGTMGMKAEPGVGSLYRLESDWSVAKVMGGVSISNGLGWSPDDRTMYYTDTPTRTIQAFDYEPDSGRFGNRRSFVTITDGPGKPDGLAVDAEGFVWTALWPGWAVHRYSPAGDLDLVVSLPVAQVANCAFGGRELDDLYITTAANGLSAADIAVQPHAGGIFVFRAGVPGLPVHEFAG